MSVRSSRVLVIAALGETVDAFLLPLRDELVRRGHTVAFGCATEPAGATPGSWFHLPNIRDGWRMIPAALALCRLIRRWRPDIIHLHTPYAVLLGRLCARLMRVRSISVIHGTPLDDPGRRRTAFVVAEALTARMSAATVTLNEPDRRFYEAIGVRDLTVAPSGGGGVRRLTSPRRAAGGCSVVYVGRLARSKGLDDLVAACRIVRAGHPSLELVLVGEALASDDRWEPDDEAWVRCVGYQPDPSSYLSDAGCYVSLSLREGWGVSVAEAVLAGVPAVVSDNRGHRQIAKSASEWVTTVPSRSPRDAAAAVAQVLQRGGAMSSGAENQRQELMDDWSPQRNACFHADVCERVL